MEFIKKYFFLRLHGINAICFRSRWFIKQYIFLLNYVKKKKVVFLFCFLLNFVPACNMNAVLLLTLFGKKIYFSNHFLCFISCINIFLLGVGFVCEIKNSHHAMSLFMVPCDGILNFIFISITQTAFIFISHFLFWFCLYTQRLEQTCINDDWQHPYPYYIKTFKHWIKLQQNYANTKKKRKQNYKCISCKQGPKLAKQINFDLVWLAQRSARWQHRKVIDSLAVRHCVTYKENRKWYQRTSGWQVVRATMTRRRLVLSKRRIVTGSF